MIDNYAPEFDNRKKASYAFVSHFEDIFQAEGLFPKEKSVFAFPAKKHVLKDKDGEDIELIYPVEKYNKDMSPLCTYIPTNKVLLSLMRLTITIKDEKDLVFYQNYDDKEL